MKGNTDSVPLEAAPMLDLQGACPESHCSRHSPAIHPGDRLSMRLSSHAVMSDLYN
jgi:hypothetical protein